MTQKKFNSCESPDAIQSINGLRCLQISKFYPPVPGGIESVVFEITEGLWQLGAMMEVLCSNTGLVSARDNYPYPVLRTGSLGSLLSISVSPALPWQLLLQRRHYDVIHLHLPNPMANLAVYLARPAGRLVLHWHSDIIKQKRALRLYAPLQEWLLRQAHAIVATSEAYARSSPWLQPYASKVHVIPIGIRDPLLERKEDQRHTVQALRERVGNRRIVFALGRATYYKGFDVLIRAASRLPDDVSVVIGGDGALLPELRALTHALGVSDRVHLAGQIAQEDLAAYYHAAEVFCLPSLVRSEAFGVVLLEAMAHSLPIVASEIEGSGVPWVNLHGETGLNVPPGDPDALAAALNCLLRDDSLRQRFGQAGRQRFEQEFTADKMVARTACLYQRLPTFPPSLG